MRLTFLHRTGAAPGVDYYRSELPYRHLFDDLYARGVELVPGRSFSDPNPYETVVIQRDLTPQGMELVRRWKRAGKRIVWSIDDDFWHIPEWSPAFGTVDLAALDELRELADAVCVSTDELANVVGSKAVVCPNLIDPTPYRVRPRQDGPIHVVWAGSAYHAGDLEAIRPLLARAIRSFGGAVTWTFFGWCPDWLRYMVNHVPPVALADYPKTLCELTADIGLAPLEANPFNACKSAIKWYEYSLAGIATLASPVGPYQCIRGCVDGYFGGDNWFEVLSGLVDGGREKLVRTARNARRRVLDGFTWNGSHVDSWRNLFLS